MALTEWEYKEYKNAINKEVYKYVEKERDRGNLVSLITDAIDTGSKRRKLEDKLLAYVDKNVAYKLADKAFMVLEDLSLKVKNSNKRSYKDDSSDKDAKRARKEEKRKEKKEVKEEEKVSNNSNGPNVVKSTSKELQAQQIKDCMAKAQAAIELRKKQLAIQTATLGNLLPAQKALSMTPGIPNSIEVASRIAQLQARIQVQLGNTALPPVPTIPAQKAIIPPLMSLDVDGTQSPEDQSKPTPLILDDKGRTVDTSGKEVHYIHRAPTLKANIRAKKREEFKQQFLEKPVEEVVEGQFYDPRVPFKPHVRLKRGFKFHEKGKFIQVAQRERAKSRLEKLQGQISAVAKRTGISSAAKLAQLEQRESKDVDVAPIVEWWDSIILQDDRYPPEGEPVRLKEDIISCLVEHPMEMKCPKETKTEDPKVKVLLTNKEHKKLRRMNRRETWKERQEKIRLGLEPPPEPKVRMANLMRVLGTEAVLDPTKMEKHVREQMAKRLKAHEDANKARKLTPEQRNEKKTRKLIEDTSSGVNVTVYRVTDLSNGSHKYKIETNAKQLFMTGTVVLFKDVNVVVVEGGPKQQQTYKRLMMERIKWVEESRSKNAQIQSKCELIWEGMVPERSFGDLQFKSCPSELFARDHFLKHGVEHYWDLCYGRKVLEEAEDVS